MAQILITTTVAAGPTQFVATPHNYRVATMIACKSLAGPSAAANAGIVKVGQSGTASQQPLEFNPGDERVFHAAAGQMLDLSRYYLTVANDGDGLAIIYE